MVGAGIFGLPAALAAGAGRWSLAVLFLGIAFASVMALCMVEVASRFDATGGPMHYAHVAFGPTIGFLVGWLMYLSRLSAFGAISAIMLDYATPVWPMLRFTTVRVGVVTLFVGLLVGINLRGVGRAALANNLFTTVKAAALVLLVVTGLWFGGVALAPPVSPTGLAEIGGAVALTIFACMGFEHATIVAGEARNPRRDLPASILWGVCCSGVLYALVLMVCFRVVPDLAHSQRPLADAAAALGGPIGATAMSLAAAFSCASSLTVWMLVVPRLLFVLGGQGNLPRIFATVAAWTHACGGDCRYGAARMGPNHHWHVLVSRDLCRDRADPDVCLHMRGPDRAAAPRRCGADHDSVRSVPEHRLAAAHSVRARNHERYGRA